MIIVSLCDDGTVMLTLQPDIQQIYPDDLDRLLTILDGLQIESVSIYNGYALFHNQQVGDEHFPLYGPVRVFVKFDLAVEQAERLRSRGRRFTIRRVPLISFDFGRHQVMICLPSQHDIQRFLRPRCQYEGNVIRPARFARRLPWLTSSDSRGLLLLLKTLLNPATCFFTSVHLASPSHDGFPWVPGYLPRASFYNSFVQDGILSWQSSKADNQGPDWVIPTFQEICWQLDDLHDMAYQGGS